VNELEFSIIVEEEEKMNLKILQNLEIK
jgi:hypothetical protein